MDRARKELLLNNGEIGRRFAAYLSAHGINNDAAAKRIGLTNFSRYVNGLAGVSWEAIIKAAHSFNVDPSDIVNYLDPGPRADRSDIQITGENERAFRMLSKILNKAEKRVADGIVVNLEQFCKALGEEEKSPAQPEGSQIMPEVPAVETNKKRQKGRGRKRSAMSHSPPLEKQASR
jgi:transcriptional regulator with XRE-family HTH domain